ncbi:nucleotidyltransferase domain-containing protein [Ramlibacter ginsenosidimutans]
MNAALMSELFGGAGRYKALRCLYEEPARAFGTRELAAAAGIDPANASRWLRRWSEVGLVERRLERGAPVFQASRDPGLAALAQLLQQDTRTRELLAGEVDKLGDKVEAAAIFGSAAKGTSDAGSDVDLLLLTDLPQLKAQALFKAPGRALGRPVNVLAYSPSAWREAVRKGDAFVREILDSPMVPVKGDVRAAQA